MGRKIQLVYKQKIVTQFSTQDAKFLGEERNVQSASSTELEYLTKKKVITPFLHIILCFTTLPMVSSKNALGIS